MTTRTMCSSSSSLGRMLHSRTTILGVSLKLTMMMILAISTSQAFVLPRALSSSVTGRSPVSRSSFTGSSSSSSTVRKTSTTALWGLTKRPRPPHRDPKDMQDDDDEEDDVNDDIDLSQQDWRAFRAKLVRAEHFHADEDATVSSSKKTHQQTAHAMEWDDGLGALFAEEIHLQHDALLQHQSDQQHLQQQQEELHHWQQQHATGLTPLDPSQWAYDSGNVIEQGAVILGGVEQEYGFALRQQYFHKAAILVLEHDDHKFTKGIILNRPTDLTLVDDLNPGVQWRVWYGGDVQGLGTPNPDIICLHSLSDSRVAEVSMPVMKDIQYTTFQTAKELVQAGVASPTDFWVFCGYAGWGPGQLSGELDRKSWYMVATDPQTLLKEMARLLWVGCDPREAGLDTWSLLMHMIGRGAIADACQGDFHDLMLKEWARQHLLSTTAGGGAEPGRNEAARLRPDVPGTSELLPADWTDRLMQRVSAAWRGEEVMEGTLVRAAASDRSPFLLDNQELHKSIILIIKEDENLSLGVMLNRPAAKGLEVQVTDRDTDRSRTETVPMRFGGPYTVKGENESMLWLHSHPVLKACQVGRPVGLRPDGIWQCTSADMVAAVSQGMATPQDFLVVTGVSVWTKGEDKGPARGMQGEIRSGRFEMIPPDRVQDVWNVLIKQETLNDGNLASNLALADSAWMAGASAPTHGATRQPPPAHSFNWPLGAGHPRHGGAAADQHAEDSSWVFQSNTKVSQLSDDALKSWVATFLLGRPALGP